MEDFDPFSHDALMSADGRASPEDETIWGLLPPAEGQVRPLSGHSDGSSPGRAGARPAPLDRTIGPFGESGKREQIRMSPLRRGDDEESRQRTIEGALGVQDDGTLAPGMLTEWTTASAQPVAKGDDKGSGRGSRGPPTPRWRGSLGGAEEGSEATPKGPPADRATTSRGKSAASTEGGGGGARDLPSPPRPATAGEDQEAETNHLQDQIRVFMQKKAALRRQERTLRKEMIQLRRRIQALELERAAAGGMDAVQENDKRIRRSKDIMEKRIMKAREGKMKAQADNDKVRRSINEKRREKAAVQKAIQDLESDIGGLQARTTEQLQQIRDLDQRTRDAESQLAGVLEQSRQELQEMEQAWEELNRHASRAKFQTSLPTPRDDPEAQQAAKQLEEEEKEAIRPPKHVPRDPRDPAPAPPASLLNTRRRRAPSPIRRKKRPGSSRAERRRRWKQAALRARVQATKGKVSSLKELFEELQQRTGCETVEDFVERFIHANEKNYQLFSRVDTLTKEADDVRGQIMQLRATIRQQALQSQTEEAEKRGMLVSVETSLAAASERLRREEQQMQGLEELMSAFMGGLKQLLETLDLGNIVREGRATNQMPGRLMGSYFTALDHRVRQLLATYATHAGRMGILPSVEPWAAKHPAQAGVPDMPGSPTRGGRESEGRGQRRRSTAGRGSVDAGVAQPGKMTRAERRHSVDMSIIDIRRGMIMAAASGEGEADMTPSASQRVSKTAAVASQALVIGPS